MRYFLTSIIIGGVTFFSGTADAQSFAEMPSDTGTYIADFGSVSGWKIIGLGTRRTSSCFAFKGELDALTQPTIYRASGDSIILFKSGTAFILRRDKPYSFQQLDNSIRLYVSGRYSQTDASYEWRWDGDKFFTPLERGGRYGDERMRLTLDELTPNDGKVLDVKASSWEYPSIIVGYSDDSGKLSLTGIAQVKSKIESCEAALIQEFPSHY